MNKTLKDIKKIYLVSSGKGGVGKSSLSSLISLALARSGKKVGLLDADIYGPSIPAIFGYNDHALTTKDNKFIPVESSGIKLISMGFLVKEDSALAWRGPMITKSLNQLLFSTYWGELDYLIVDMPPGTGDIHLSFAKSSPIDGVYIVTTPDILSEKDVNRAIDLYKKLNIPIAGLIENMSHLEHDGKKVKLFGEGALDRISKKYEIQNCVKLPLINSLSDKLQNIDLHEIKEFLDL